MVIMRVPNSTPIVRSCRDWNFRSVNCSKRQLFPTQVSPMTMYLNKYSWVLATWLILGFFSYLQPPHNCPLRKDWRRKREWVGRQDLSYAQLKDLSHLTCGFRHWNIWSVMTKRRTLHILSAFRAREFSFLLSQYSLFWSLLVVVLSCRSANGLTKFQVLISRSRFTFPLMNVKRSLVYDDMHYSSG